MSPSIPRWVILALGVGLILFGIALLVLASPAAAHPVPGGLPLALGPVPERTSASAAQAAEDPPLVPVPRATCGPRSRPETDIQGRVPPGNPEGFTCNTTLVGQHGSSGGYKALRFTDKAGRECAYYDTTLLFPTNVQTLSERPTGVAVLDMSNPARPVQTDVDEARGNLVFVGGERSQHFGLLALRDLGEV